METISRICLSTRVGRHRAHTQARQPPARAGRMKRRDRCRDIACRSVGTRHHRPATSTRPRHAPRSPSTPNDRRAQPPQTPTRARTEPARPRHVEPPTHARRHHTPATPTDPKNTHPNPPKWTNRPSKWTFRHTAALPQSTWHLGRSNWCRKIQTETLPRDPARKEFGPRFSLTASWPGRPTAARPSDPSLFARR